MKKIKGIFLTFVFLVVALGCNAVYASTPDISHFMYPEYSKTISMDFKDATLKDALKIFSQQSGLNFIAAEGIAEKTITLYLDNVPVEVALERILDANNLTYEMHPESNIFVVKAVVRPETELITRVYSLKHATVRSSKLNNTISIAAGDGKAASSASADAGLVNALKAVLTENGSIVENPRTNSLVITDIPVQFPIIEKTLARLDVPIPQVLIEVEMLDVSKSVADKLGIKAGETPLTFTGAERDHVYPWDQNELLRKGYVFEAAEYRVGTISAAGLTATLQLLRTHSDTKNLARPRILTLNNETAQIKISTDEAIGSTTSTSGGESGVATTSVEAERVQTGVSLTVTPQVNLLTRDITMAIAPKVIEARTGGTFSGVTFKDPEERGTQSILRVHSGDTIMIGGLLRSDVSKTITRVPILSDIPVIGAAFRHKDTSDTDRELIIFITPHIVVDTLSGELAFKGPLPLQREQEIPQVRLQEVEKALAAVESQRR